MSISFLIIKSKRLTPRIHAIVLRKPCDGMIRPYSVVMEICLILHFIPWCRFIRIRRVIGYDDAVGCIWPQIYLH